ncbi:MAG: L,D-transpeptidase family protein [Pseudomonadota bacterium]
MTSNRNSRGGHRGAVSGAVAALACAGLVASPLFAQNVPAPRGQNAPRPAPTPAPVPMASPSPVVQPIPGDAAPTARQAIPLPVLTPRQAAQMTDLLRTERVAQGLQRIDEEYPIPTDNDGLVRAILDYAHAVHSGRLAPEDFQADWGLRPAAYDPLPEFAAAAAQDRLAQWFAALPPPYAGYEGLKDELATYRTIAANGGWKTLAAGPDLKLGSTGARVVALRERLAVEDASVVTTGASFDADLEEAVKRVQRRYGLNPSGLVSAQTLAALNVPVADRVRQIMANMERWRWLPRELPTTRIQVNVAAAVMAVFEGDRPVFSMRAVTGRPGNETPMLVSAIHSVVLNPPWNVPSGIAAKELWPKGAAYLKRNGYKVIGTGANRRLQQQAGPQSALGRYKFDFDNPYAVYLHDTPSQATFSRFDRLASHGCVRLEKPGALAVLLLKDDPNWTQEAIQAAVDTGVTQRVPLPNKVAVFLLYWTAYASSDGGMNFRSDPYGWDKKLAQKIEARAAIQARAGK